MIIGAIVGKDLRAFSRDRLWMIMTPLSMVLFVTAFWCLPRHVNETITVGVYPPLLANALEALTAGEDDSAQSHAIITFDSEKTLAAAVSGEGARDVPIGIAFPPNFTEAILAGEQIKVTVYLDASVPAGITNAISSEIREIAFAIHAAAQGRDPLETLPITMPAEERMVLGDDRAGNQVPLREKMRPMLAILILLVEALALAGLVAVEIEQRTVTALLVTPARSSDLLAAKGITGAILAVGQGLFFLLATQSFGANWLLVLILMFLGAVMMSAVGLIAGAAGKDFMSTLFYGMALIVPLMIPAFTVLFPGSAAVWVKLMPSHGLIEALVSVMGYGRGWGDIAPHIGATLAWDALLLGFALFILKRKMEAL